VAIPGAATARGEQTSDARATTVTTPLTPLLGIPVPSPAAATVPVRRMGTDVAELVFANCTSALATVPPVSAVVFMPYRRHMTLPGCGLHTVYFFAATEEELEPTVTLVTSEAEYVRVH
jgi:hypothetical protein